MPVRQMAGHRPLTLTDYKVRFVTASLSPECFLPFSLDIWHCGQDYARWRVKLCGKFAVKLTMIVGIDEYIPTPSPKH